MSILSFGATWRDRSLPDIAGRQVVEIRLSEDRRAIALDLDNGDTLAGMVDGDCCSQTEICHLSGVQTLLRYPITSVRLDELAHPSVPRPEVDWPQESEACYGITIATTGGAFTIDYRNYSNGYYGGSMDECPAGELIKGRWRTITTDE